MKGAPSNPVPKGVILPITLFSFRPFNKPIQPRRAAFAKTCTLLKTCFRYETFGIQRCPPYFQQDGSVSDVFSKACPVRFGRNELVDSRLKGIT